LKIGNNSGKRLFTMRENFLWIIYSLGLMIFIMHQLSV
jgi:hypothetical protein